MACSKYSITNTGSTPVNFTYRRCDDSMWEYQVEVEPSETKNIWLINDSYSTAYVNSIVVSGVTAYPPPPPTTDVYSQDLEGDFPITYVSCSFECDGSNFNSEYTSETANSVQDIADIFNADTNFNQYGTYFDNGDNRLGLTILKSELYVLCLSGDISLDVFSD